MPTPERFESLILGSGQGGKLLAWHLGHTGRRVAVVERQWVGGACPAVACLPSKNEIWSARVAHLAQHAAHFGTQTGVVTTNLAKVRQRIRAMIEREAALHIQAYQASGAELIMASGRFVAPKTIEARLQDGTIRLLEAEQVFINVGTHAAIPSLRGLAAARPLTHIEALALERLPRHLIVLGGGYVGIEMAQAFRRFGSRVTVIEHGPQILSREDRDIADELQRILRSEGVEFVLDAHPVDVARSSADSVSVRLRVASGEHVIEGSEILVAVGRIPNTADIGLERANVELDAAGYIRVNERLQTTAPGVWAIGECAGSPQFTHISVDDFRVIRDNLAGKPHGTRDRLVPYCVFTDPPLAHVGLTEAEARRQGIVVRVVTLPMKNVLRTQATDESAGFMKAVLSSEDDRILGFTMIGSEAGEVMAVVQTAMLANLPYTQLRDAVFTHLTFVEGLGPLLSNVPPRPGA